jgi:NCS1 family nucleobase:cation symporter-1
VVEFGEAVWDPVVLITRLTEDLPVLLVLAMVIIVIAQISTNMAANVVSPSNDFSNLSPRRISFKQGGLITAVIGIVSFPWVLYEDAGAYIFTWLVGYGSLLGAIGAVMIVDYWILRRRQLDVAALYDEHGRYAYSGGWNWRAIAAVLIGIAPAVPGFIEAATTEGGLVSDPNLLNDLYSYGVFLTFAIAGLVYFGLTVTRRETEARTPVAAPVVE